jgi:uncharacterized SAM-binding protein YcdF (DUF218 family)
LRKAAASLVLLAALCVILYASREPIFRFLGSYLVLTDPPATAEVALVLGGDGFGTRILKGCELVRTGVVKKAWVSGSMAFYGSTEPKLAIQYAAMKGCPEEYFMPIEGNPDSTRDEANIVGAELRRRGLKELVLVTSNFHTRRAGKIFRETVPDITLHVVASVDPFFTPDTWWKTRQGRKVFFFEWVKTITERLGM